MRAASQRRRVWRFAELPTHRETPKLSHPKSVRVRAPRPNRLPEQRGFASGYELEDWLLAEREVDALLGAHHGAAPQ